jgi:transcriptional regulator of met regulon
MAKLTLAQLYRIVKQGKAIVARIESKGESNERTRKQVRRIRKATVTPKLGPSL